MRAEALIRAARPASAELHLIESGIGHHALVVDGSRMYDLDPDGFQALRDAIANGEVAAALAAAGLVRPMRAIDDRPLAPPPVHALSLAVAQKCNLGCAYCYAREGSFGGPPKNMDIAMGRTSVDLLLADKKAGDRVNLAFMGGEPLTNRAVLRQVTQYAVDQAAHRDVTIGFSITTNGTLVNEADADFFEAHGFAVTISLDGPRALHDRLRPYKAGRGSFDTIRRNIAALLSRQRRMQVSARVTVTPVHDDLPGILDEFIALGFHGVGFSPMLNAPGGQQEMTRDDLTRMLEGMIACGMAFERRTARGDRYPFANMLQALREIHKGTHRPYPCGAGAGYLGVSADGDLSACHRFVGDPAGALGSLAEGLDRSRQAEWLAARHVHRQSPCHTCWARYLCGGGCHHEVINRERRACDYIRGWLHYCLGAYVRLSAIRPDLFDGDDWAVA